MRQNCAIEKSQAVKNIEYQNKPGEKGKRVQPTDIYMENYKSVLPDPVPDQGILFDRNHIYGPAGSFHQKCQLCLLQKVLQTVNSMGSRSHSFPLLRRSWRAAGSPEQPILWQRGLNPLSQCHSTLFFTPLLQLSNFTNN